MMDKLRNGYDAGRAGYKGRRHVPTWPLIVIVVLGFDILHRHVRDWIAALISFSVVIPYAWVVRRVQRRRQSDEK